jgi:hypothetical protein
MGRAVYETPPNRKKIDVATAADHELVAAVAGLRMRVLSLTLTAANTVTITWKSGATQLSGAMTLVAGVPLTLPYNPVGWLESAAGESLVLALGGGVQVSGVLTYEKVLEAVQ